jgi:hypothetical protein
MNWAKQTARTLRARSEPPSSRALSTWGYEEPSEVKIIPEGSRSKPKTPIGIGPGLCIMLVGNFREFRLDELPRILIPRTWVNKGKHKAGAPESPGSLIELSNYLCVSRLPRLGCFNLTGRDLGGVRIIGR